jgi:hypothetical protein
LKSLSKILNAKDATLDTYVIGNAPRPLLSYGVKNSKATRKTYLYVDAMRKFEKETREIDLTEAYKKARPAFAGKLEQTFIILKDNVEEEDQMLTGSNAEPIANK